MSIEIALQAYQFMDFQNQYTYDSSCGIHANYLHDLESIFWIVMWTMFKYQKETESTDSKSIHAQKKGSKILFSNTENVARRRNFLMKKHFFDEVIKHVPGYFKELKTLATTFKDHLLRVYYKEESEITVGNPIRPSNEEVYNSILEAFRSYTIANRDDGLMITLIRPQSSLKRSTPDEDSETNEKQRKKQR